MPLVLFWVGLSVWLGFKAAANGRSFWGWFPLGMIADPIVGWLLYGLVGKNR